MVKESKISLKVSKVNIINSRVQTNTQLWKNRFLKKEIKNTSALPTTLGQFYWRVCDRQTSDPPLVLCRNQTLWSYLPTENRWSSPWIPDLQIDKEAVFLLIKKSQRLKMKKILELRNLLYSCHHCEFIWDCGAVQQQQPPGSSNESKKLASLSAGASHHSLFSLTQALPLIILPCLRLLPQAPPLSMRAGLKCTFLLEYVGLVESNQCKQMRFLFCPFLYRENRSASHSCPLVFRNCSKWKGLPCIHTRVQPTCTRAIHKQRLLSSPTSCTC